MKKKLLAVALLISTFSFAQLYSPNAGVAVTTNPTSNNVGVRTANPRTALDVQGRILVDEGIPASGIAIRAYDTYWARGYNFLDATGSTNLGGFGAVGDANKIDSYYIGKEYNNAVVNFYPLDKKSIFSGNVGIGTFTPEYKLEVDNGFITSKISDYAVAPSNKVGFLINELGTNIFDISYARDGLGTLKMKTFLDHPITFGTNNIERMRINAAGDIGIGTNSPVYKLDVVGNAQFQDIISGGSNSWIFHTPDDGRKTLHIAYGGANAWEWGKAFVLSGETGNAALNGKFEAKEVKVTLSPTADFVFEENYSLPKLEDVEKHIKEKKHLPEIASAKVMEKEGVNVGEFQIKLLQKIEELTLYTIEQDKENKSQSEEIKELKKQVQQLLSTKK